jgi:hypothetical protein
MPTKASSNVCSTNRGASATQNIDRSPRVVPGTTASAKRIDQHTIEISYKVKGKLVSTDRMVLSKDGKTLTSTVSFPGVAKSEIDVCERQ